MITKERRNEIISELFNRGTSIRLEKTGKKKDDMLAGFYINQKYKNIGNKEIEKLDQIDRLFLNTRAKTKLYYGGTNQSDFENNYAECHVFLYEVLDSILEGTANVEDDLKVNTEEDFYRIINDEKLVSKLCSFCITYVHMKVMTAIKQKSNPDYSYNSATGYTPISYYYLDDYSGNEDDVNPYDVLPQEELECETGEFTEYVLSNHIDCLTNKQRVFIEDYLRYGKHPKGHIEDLDGNVLYSKQLVNTYRKGIAKRLLKRIDEDERIKENENGRFVLKKEEK
jgi:hypothetical protein